MLGGTLISPGRNLTHTAYNDTFHRQLFGDLGRAESRFESGRNRKTRESREGKVERKGDRRGELRALYAQ
jgi:hypothetical protein